MIRLGLETSTMIQSIAVEVDHQLVASRAIRQQVGHAESLLSSVQGTLDDAGCTLQQIQEVVCGLGPGSFTGIRIGLAFAMGMARSRHIPLFGVHTLRAMTSALPTTTAVAVALDARKSEVYGAIYAATPEREELVTPATWKPSEFFDAVAHHTSDPIVLTGNGPLAFPDQWEPYRDRIQYPQALHTPNAWGLLIAHRQGHGIAAMHNVLEPLYIRPSDVRRPPS